MRLSQSLLLLATAGSTAHAAEKQARPRGVGPECEYLNPDSRSTLVAAAGSYNGILRWDSRPILGRIILTTCHSSLEILSGLRYLHLHFQPLRQNPLLGGQ